MKRIISFCILIALGINCIMVDASVVSEKKSEIQEKVQIKKSKACMTAYWHIWSIIDNK